jgi:ferrous-iron efflux pump FieF
MTDIEKIPMKEKQNQDYAFWVSFAALAATGTALILVAIKLYAWLVTDSSAMLASTTDSMLDLFASLMNVVILKFALAPADDEHKFGHGKAESLAGLVQAAFVLGSASLLLFHGVDRFITPQTIVHSEVGIWITIVAIVLTLALVIFQKMVIKKTKSVAIGADSLHYQSDLILNVGVLAAIILSQSIWKQADGLFTILVGVFLFVGAGKIIWQSVYHLMDHELSDEEISKITAIILAHEKTLGMHELRTRQAGPDRFIQFHLELDDSLSLLEAHNIGEEIEVTLIDAFHPCDVFVHLDPASIIKGK